LQVWNQVAILPKAKSRSLRITLPGTRAQNRGAILRALALQAWTLAFNPA
jgi:hypothetical protein